NTASCTQTVVIDDEVPPILTCPPAPTAECTIQEAPPYATLAELLAAGGSATDNCGINAASFLLVSEVSDGQTCPETVTRTYRIADLCGNTATCQQVIVVDDHTPPVVVWPEDVTFSCANCPSDPSPALTGSPAASDKCGVTIAHTDTVTGGCPMVITRTWVVSDGCNTVTHDQMISCLPQVFVTDSSLCLFDVDPSTAAQEFRLIYTLDPATPGCQKLTASNPGQYYFNVIASGTPGQPVTLTMTLPYPFVVQGANPVHAYHSVAIGPDASGKVCLDPGAAIPVEVDSGLPRVVSDYQGGAFYTVTVTVPVLPASGAAYVNILLLRGGGAEERGLTGIVNHTFDRL
ncbi:MAG: hypothetical protein ACKO3N_01660, partial [Verrucomicrobiota bacterium]